MFQWLSNLKEASSETKQFVITVIILVVIVFGTFFYAYGRLDQSRPNKSLYKQTERSNK